MAGGLRLTWGFFWGIDEKCEAVGGWRHKCCVWVKTIHTIALSVTCLEVLRQPWTEPDE